MFAHSCKSYKALLWILSKWSFYGKLFLLISVPITYLLLGNSYFEDTKIKSWSLNKPKKSELLKTK